MVKDIYEGTGFGDPHNFYVFNNTLFFSATNDKGAELWKSDGTATGTVMVKDIRPGNESSRPAKFTKVGNTLFFITKTTGNGYEVWKTDGTENGTRLVKDISSNDIGYLSNFVEFKDHLVFFAEAITNRGIWISDGSEAGTTIFHNMTAEQHRSVLQIVATQNYLYIFIQNSITNELELWQNDGTPEGIYLMGKYHYSNSTDNFSEAQIINNSLWFLARPENGNLGLFCLPDHSDEPVLETFNKNVSLTRLHAFDGNNTIYLRGNDFRGNELWKYTIEGSTGIKNPGLKEDDNPMNLSVWPNPFDNRIRIELPEGISGSYAVEIVDIAGRIWITSSSERLIGNTPQIETGQLKEGIYVVRLSGNGSNYFTKIIKK